MTTELIGTPEPRPIPRRGLLPFAATLSQAKIRYATIIIALALAYYHVRYEGWLHTVVFASSITASLVLALTFLSRRMLFSITLIALMIFTVVIAASVKHHYLEMVLHAYDVVFYLTSWSTIVFLWSSHKSMLLALVGMFALTIVTGLILWRVDTSRVPRWISAALFVVCVAAASWASYAKGERKNTLFYWDNLFLSSFYASWSETAETLWKGQLLDASRSQPLPPFKVSQCDLQEKPPHIILIHQESAVPPSYFPQIDYDHELDPFFRSFDGQLHKLRVETYGGASWLTEFSVLAGVSTYSFGGMRTFVQSLMQGKIHDAVPQVLARCGYTNSVFYPVPQAFVSNGRFYATVGMPQIYDYRAQGAKRFDERDRFYYANAMKDIARHLTDSESPIFTFVITSATHLPYTNTYAPEMNVSGGGPGTDPEMNEYLRRLSLAHMDYNEFRDDLAKRFPKERFLIVQYGDHQPIATRTLLGFDKTTFAEDIKLTPESPGMLTYYSINGVNYDPPPMPAVDVLEVPYLGTVMLHAAGIPLPEAYDERLRLMLLCNGRYFTCKTPQAILSFHRRLMDSGLIEAR